MLDQYNQALQQNNDAQAKAYFAIYSQIVNKSNETLLNKLGQSSQRADQILQKLQELDQELIAAAGKRTSP